MDLSKAYDIRKWSFIYLALREASIPENLCALIMACITSVQTNVLWNGSRSDFFHPKRGLRQGDPLSPYIFVICMNKLSHLISHEVVIGRWKSLRAGSQGPSISHLMFSNDLLLFGQTSTSQM